MNVVAINVNPPKLFSGVRASVHFVGKTLAIWRARSLERRQLAAMSSAQLKDIGLTLSDARFEANKEFWQD